MAIALRPHVHSEPAGQALVGQQRRILQEVLPTVFVTGQARGQALKERSATQEG